MNEVDICCWHPQGRGVIDQLVKSLNCTELIQGQGHAARRYGCMCVSMTASFLLIGPNLPANWPKSSSAFSRRCLTFSCLLLLVQSWQAMSSDCCKECQFEGQHSSTRSIVHLRRAVWAKIQVQHVYSQRQNRLHHLLFLMLFMTVHTHYFLLLQSIPLAYMYACVGHCWSSTCCITLAARIPHSAMQRK